MRPIDKIATLLLMSIEEHDAEVQRLYETGLSAFAIAVERDMTQDEVHEVLARRRAMFAPSRSPTRHLLARHVAVVAKLLVAGGMPAARAARELGVTSGEVLAVASSPVWLATRRTGGPDLETLRRLAERGP